MNLNELSPAFCDMVDALKQEVGCICSFLSPEQLKRIIDATKTIGPSLDGERYDTLANDAISNGDRASCIGFLFMAMVTDAINEEALAIETNEEDTDYHPIDRPAFRKHRDSQ